jgi:hypothetical protein
MRKSAFERFYRHVMPAIDGCWYWTGSYNASGYGLFHNMTLLKPSVTAHRFSYQFYKGEIINNMQVLHSCDNRKCVNPDHLFLGTNLDNVMDKMRKGRVANGERMKTNKLTKYQVLEIRASDLGCTELGKRYNLDRRTIYTIKKRITWKHLPPTFTNNP